MGLQEHCKAKRRTGKVSISKKHCSFPLPRNSIFYFSFILLVSFCHLSCEDRPQPVYTDTKYPVAPARVPVVPIPKTIKKELPLGRPHWIDSLLHKYFISVRVVKNYLTDTCPAEQSWPKESLDEFEGVKQLGHIRNNKKYVSVFVLPALTPCEQGESYYFSDISLPRLPVDSYCCHPGNIFVTDDIDEDGVNEIVEYYSTCVSKLKALRVWSLKDNVWEEVGAVTYDLDYNEVPMQKRVRKTSKGHFQLLLLTKESVRAFGKNGMWMDLSIP